MCLYACVCTCSMYTLACARMFNGSFIAVRFQWFVQNTLAYTLDLKTTAFGHFNTKPIGAYKITRRMCESFCRAVNMPTVFARFVYYLCTYTWRSYSIRCRPMAICFLDLPIRVLSPPACRRKSPAPIDDQITARLYSYNSRRSSVPCCQRAAVVNVLITNPTRFAPFRCVLRRRYYSAVNAMFTNCFDDAPLLCTSFTAPRATV